jgi:hypothetical protein
MQEGAGAIDADDVQLKADILRSGGRVKTKSQHNRRDVVEWISAGTPPLAWYRVKRDERLCMLADGIMVHTVSNGFNWIGEVRVWTEENVEFAFTRAVLHPETGYYIKDPRALTLWRKSPRQAYQAAFYDATNKEMNPSENPILILGVLGEPGQELLVAFHTPAPPDADQIVHEAPEGFAEFFNQA